MFSVYFTTINQLLQRLCRTDPPPEFMVRSGGGQLFLMMWPLAIRRRSATLTLSYEESSITYRHSDYSCCGFRFKMCWKRFSTDVFTTCPKAQVANKISLDFGYFRIFLKGGFQALVVCSTSWPMCNLNRSGFLCFRNTSEGHKLSTESNNNKTK